MAKTNASDDFFEVKNAFYLGNYQHCINEASKIRGKSLEKDLYTYRSYIALKKYRIVLDEIRQVLFFLELKFNSLHCPVAEKKPTRHRL